MAKVVVKKSDISAVLPRPDAQIVYLTSGKYFVCTTAEPVEQGDCLAYTLAPKREDKHNG